MNHRINPDLLRASQEFAGGLLAVPPTHKAGRGDSKRWAERLVIDASTVEDGESMTTLTIKFRVSPASADTVNLNRRTSGRFNFNFSAAEGTGQYIMTAISVARVKALLAAVGSPVGEEGFSLEDFFGNTAASPVIGQEVNATVVDKPDRDDPAIRRQELTNFTAVED